jgi:hypothetical protein
VVTAPTLLAEVGEPDHQAGSAVLTPSMACRSRVA